MILAHSADKLGMRVLLVHDQCETESVAGRLIRKLKTQLEQDDMEVLSAGSSFDAAMLVVADPLIQAVLLDWDLEDAGSHGPAAVVLDAVRRRNAEVPVFLFTDRENAAQIPLDVLRRTNDFIWLFEDTAAFIAGRVRAAVHSYRENLLPPCSAPWPALPGSMNIRGTRRATPGGRPF